MDDPGPAPAGDKPPKVVAPRVPEQKPRSPQAESAALAPKVDASVQRYAEEFNERRVAKLVGGVSFPDSEACDIKIPADPASAVEWSKIADQYRAEMAAWEAGGKKGSRPVMAPVDGDPAHLCEMKTMTIGKGGVDMNAYAIVRKVLAEKAEGATYHTIVSDHRHIYDATGGGNHGDPSAEVFYYRRGVGSCSVVEKSMHRCESVEELKRLMAMPDDELPPAAQRVDGDWRKGRWVPLKGERGYRNVHTGQVVRPKK